MGLKAFEKKNHQPLKELFFTSIFKEWKDKWYIKKGMFGKIRYLLDLPPTQDASQQMIGFRLGITPQKSKILVVLLGGVIDTRYFGKNQSPQAANIFPLKFATKKDV